MTSTDTTAHSLSPKESLPFLEYWAHTHQSKSSWIADFRRRGYDRYLSLGGIPTSKTEIWKYTDLSRLIRRLYQPASVKGVGDISLSLASLLTEGLLTIPGIQFVLVNGKFVPQLSSSSLPDGLRVQSLEEALLHDSDLRERLHAPDNISAMAALNAAWLGEGLVVHCKAGFLENQIVHIVLVSPPTEGGDPIVAHPHIVVLVEGHMTLIESHIGRADALTNMGASLYVAPHALLTHIRAQSGIPDTHAICSTTVTVEARGLYQGFMLTTGLGVVRNELRVTLAETEASCRLYGAYTADGNRHVDNTIFINHNAPFTTSRQLFKGVLDDGGRGVFQGRISILPQAQKSDGHQIHKALLLSPGAQVDCKPELEIYTEDVKCSHGATAGALDEETLFYLRARGLNAHTARKLLIEAFLNDVVEGLSIDIPDIPMLSDAAKAMVSLWLEDRVSLKERG